MSYDSLRRGRHSLHHQVYCITTVTRGRHPLFTISPQRACSDETLLVE